MNLQFKAMKCFVPENVHTHPTEAFCSWHFPIAILPFDIPSLFQFPITLPRFNSGTTPKSKMAITI